MSHFAINKFHIVNQARQNIRKKLKVHIVKNVWMDMHIQIISYARVTSIIVVYLILISLNV